MVNTITNFHSSLHEKVMNEPTTAVEPVNAAATPPIMYNSLCHLFDTPSINAIITLLNVTKIAGI